MRVEKHFEEFIESLNENDVRYLVVGAYALSLHARPRNTGDIDIFIDFTEDNIQNLLGAIDDFGFGSLNLSSDDFDEDSILELGYEPNRIDIMTSISGGIL